MKRYKLVISDIHIQLGTIIQDTWHSNVVAKVNRRLIVALAQQFSPIRGWFHETVRENSTSDFAASE